MSLEKLREILPEVFCPVIKAEIIEGDNAVITSEITKEIEALHKTKFSEILTLNYVLQEYGTYMQPKQKRVLQTLVKNLVN